MAVTVHQVKMTIQAFNSIIYLKGNLGEIYESSIADVYRFGRIFYGAF